MPEADKRSRFPGWILLGGAVIALGYLPTLTTPFDFIDDGNLVYPAPPGTTMSGHVLRWWDKVEANVVHLGPFRPTLWAHWEIAANTFGADALLWRSWRMLWCGLAAAAFLWLLRELKVHPIAALFAVAAAMWNPYRNEIWTSLTLAEGVAMPYALAALAAARRAAQSPKPGRWDLFAIACIFVCLGCKNTFVALIPAQIALRLLPDGLSFREGWRQGRWAAASYLLPIVMPVAHFVYFKLNWHPGQYETPGPSFEQFGRISLWMKGASGLDFLGLGLAVVLGITLYTQRNREAVSRLLMEYRATMLCAALLFSTGVVIYVPLSMMAPRYTMPGIWGWDVALALMLTLFMAIPLTRPVRVAWATLGLGIAVMMMANVSRQEKVTARTRMLWNALEHLERTAPPESRIAWVGGNPESGALDEEEGIHFQWHLLHRGRGDLVVNLYDEHGQPIERVELPPPDRAPQYRMAAGSATGSGWTMERDFATNYRFGRKHYDCRLETAPPARTPAFRTDPWVAGFMRYAFENPGQDQEYLRALTKPTDKGVSPTAQLTGTLQPQGEKSQSESDRDSR